MGIAAELVEFFSSDGKDGELSTPIPKDFTDFLRWKEVPDRPMGDGQIRGWPPNVFMPVLRTCRKLCDAGVLLHNGQSPAGRDRYIAPSSFDREAAAYGEYDFLVEGFPLVRDHFQQAVVYLEVFFQDGDRSNGTGFLFEGQQVVTALHCIDGVGGKPIKEVQIWLGDRRLEGQLVDAVWAYSTDSPPDLAVITFKADPCPNVPGFRCREGTMLEDVLVMGYPPIPGFSAAPLAAEIAQVSGDLALKSTTGSLVADEASYLARHRCYLITARVKGGNSGGPVIGRDGKVVGVVSGLPGQDDNLDRLGYAVAVPGPMIQGLLTGITSRSEDVRRLSPGTTDRGFCVHYTGRRPQ